MVGCLDTELQSMVLEKKKPSTSRQPQRNRAIRYVVVARLQLLLLAREYGNAAPLRFDLALPFFESIDI